MTQCIFYFKISHIHFSNFDKSINVLENFIELQGEIMEVKEESVLNKTHPLLVQ